jgi:DNA-binding transcriptional regulator/RsmH inhibitor MraZ
LDGQGRLIIPVALRKQLGIEDQTVRLRVFRGYIEILSESMYNTLLSASSSSSKEDLVKATRMGMGKLDKILVPRKPQPEPEPEAS